LSQNVEKEFLTLKEIKNKISGRKSPKNKFDNERNVLK
jgi:hypothetical protein